MTSSTALVSDNHLTFTVAANEIWIWTAYLYYSAAAAGDLQTSWAFPASGLLHPTARIVDAGGTGTNLVYEQTASDTQPMTLLGGVNAILQMIDVHFVNAGSAGSVTLRWAQNTSSGTATIMKTGSALVGMKLA